VASAAAVAAQRSGQTAAIPAPEVAAEVGQLDAGVAAAEARHAAEEEEAARHAGVAAEGEAVARPDAGAAAAVPRSEAALCVRAQRRAAHPSAAGLSFHLPAARLVPSARARFVHAMEGLRNAAR
jgi:hypothetical protein